MTTRHRKQYAGRRAAWPIVSGIIVGTLVGGSSTVGTAQAAFVYGLPAWWFTLGAGIGCVVLATLFAKAMRCSGVETLPQYLVRTFGTPIRPLVAVSDSIGIFLTIPGQAASAITLLTYGGSIFGIRRDVRFARDKRPYKENAACQFRHRLGRDVHVPGFYVTLLRATCSSAAALWMPAVPALLRVRTRFASKPLLWRKVATNKNSWPCSKA